MGFWILSAGCHHGIFVSNDDDPVIVRFILGNDDMTDVDDGDPFQPEDRRFDLLGPFVIQGGESFVQQ